MRFTLTPSNLALLSSDIDVQAGFDSGDYFRSATTNTSSGTTATGNKPTGTVDGDLLVACIANGNVALNSVPSGWTLADEIQNASLTWVHIYYKVASSEPASWDWTYAASGGFTLWIGAYKGRSASTLDAADAVSTPNEVTSTIPAVTTTAENDVLIVAVGTGGFRTMTEGSTMIERVDSAANPGLAVYDQVVSAIGSTGTRSITGSSGSAKAGGIAAFKY